MKILLWIGNEANQKALANKFNAVFPLAGIITESRIHKQKITVAKIFEKLIEKIFLPEVGSSWWGMKNYYQKLFPSYPDVLSIDVENINSDLAYEFTKKIKPDLILVSGTRLVKEKMLSVNPSIGIMNLHTGLSPYIKGGPNCTNWCIATGQYHLIGNTVMWIDAGIDSGNIFATEFTDFSGNESLGDVHIKVMNHAHELYLKSVKQILAGVKTSISQNEIAPGKTYFTKEWGLGKKICLIANMKHFRNAVVNGDVQLKRKEVRVVNAG